jgi:hypothetical protein
MWMLFRAKEEAMRRQKHLLMPVWREALVPLIRVYLISNKFDNI